MSRDEAIQTLLQAIRLDWLDIARNPCNAEMVAASRQHIGYCYGELRQLMQR